MVDAHADPALVTRHVVDAVGDRLAEFLVHEVVDEHLLGLTARLPLAPAVLEFPTSSFFFVSTEITGWPRLWNA